MQNPHRQSIEPIIHRSVVHLSEEDSIAKASRAMRENHDGFVLVHDAQGRFSGILTDRDIAIRAVATEEPPQASIGRFMTPDPVCVEEGDSLQKVCDLMERLAVRRIPVVRPLPGEQGRTCVGVVTLDDLIVSQWVEPRMMSRIVRRQLRPDTARSRVKLTRVTEGKAGVRSQTFDELGTTPRSKAHQDQTYGEMIHFVEKELDGVVPSDRVPEFLLRSLGAIVQKLTPTAASNFLAQLPQRVQERLYELPSGPIRELTVVDFLDDLATEFGFSTSAAAEDPVCRTLAAVRMQINGGDFDKIQAQLPKDWKAFLQKAFRALAA